MMGNDNDRSHALTVPSDGCFWPPPCGRFLTTVALVHADVRDLHCERKRALVDAFFATPVAADRNVQANEKWLVEWPCLRVVHALVLACVRQRALLVDEHGELGWRPLQRVHVEARVRTLARRARGDVRASVPVVVALCVHTRVQDALRPANVLDDVDLAAVGPAAVGIVRGEHPDSRPSAPRRRRQLGAHLDAAIQEVALVPRDEPRGREATARVVLDARGDLERAVAHVGVLLPLRRVPLLLGVLRARRPPVRLGLV
mmetsp:Transcript_17785/g.45997  ORF Transcript_17785/g.45997 Transcript_17785/m.45997 type:complete len:259 (+) Transcript_17785:175-951(+)